MEGQGQDKWWGCEPLHKATGSGNVHGACEEWPGEQSLVFNVSDSFTDSAFIEDGFLVNQARHQGSGAQLIDAAGDTLGVVENAGDGIVGKERASGKTSDADVVFDVAEGFLQVKGAEVVAHR